MGAAMLKNTKSAISLAGVYASSTKPAGMMLSADIGRES